MLTPWPVQKPKDYIIQLNQSQSEDEEKVIEKSIQRGNPYGENSWNKNIIEKFNLEMTIRSKGRPRKGS